MPGNPTSISLGLHLKGFNNPWYSLSIPIELWAEVHVSLKSPFLLFKPPVFTLLKIPTCWKTHEKPPFSSMIFAINIIKPPVFSWIFPSTPPFSRGFSCHVWWHPWGLDVAAAKVQPLHLNGDRGSDAKSLGPGAAWVAWGFPGHGPKYQSGRWFQTFFMFLNSWDDDPIWRTPSFFRGVGIPPTSNYKWL